MDVPSSAREVSRSSASENCSPDKHAVLNRTDRGQPSAAESAGPKHSDSEESDMEEARSETSTSEDSKSDTSDNPSEEEYQPSDSSEESGSDEVYNRKKKRQTKGVDGRQPEVVEPEVQDDSDSDHKEYHDVSPTSKGEEARIEEDHSAVFCVRCYTAESEPEETREGSSPSEDPIPVTLEKSNVEEQFSTEQQHTCAVCDFIAPTKPKLMLHRLCHTKQGPFTCEECGFSTTQKRLLSSHIKGIHLNDIKSFQCTTCGFRTAYKNTLKKHIAMHLKRSANKKAFQCTKCDFSTKWKHHLPSHMETHKEIDCGVCGFRGSFAAVAKHMQTHVKQDDDKPQETLTCMKCDFKTTSAEVLTKHTKAHQKRDRPKQIEDNKFLCEECGFTAANPSRMLRHKRTHTGEKPYKCDQCSYAAAYKSHLRMHMYTHTGDCPFVCEHCGYRAATKSIFTLHQRTHTGEKPFKCDLCNFASANKTRLKAHMTNHRGEKPYVCDQCRYRTAYKENLSKHMKTHAGEKPYRCTHCDYAAAFKGSLVGHMKRHHPGEKELNTAHSGEGELDGAITHVAFQLGKEELKAAIANVASVVELG